MDEELLARQAPQSLEAEQSVLGSILIDSQCVADVIGILRSIICVSLSLAFFPRWA